jgi:hypothetical protein
MPTEVEGWTVDQPEFLAALVRQASAQANDLPNLYWKRAYLALADAADRLHAMTMRTMVKE